MYSKNRPAHTHIYGCSYDAVPFACVPEVHLKKCSYWLQNLGTSGKRFIMINLFISITFEDGSVYKVDKDVYNADFDSDVLVAQHGNIIHFHVIVDT